jgi:hypothetical protein
MYSGNNLKGGATKKSKKNYTVWFLLSAIRGNFFQRALPFALTLVVLLSANGNVQAAEAKKQVKSKSKDSPPPVQMTLEPKAMEILKASCDRLAAARTMRFTAVVSEESPCRLGTPLVYTTKSDVTLQRPDKLRVITPADGPASEFYYNGKTMIAFAPAENLVAVADAPPTIDAALKAAYDSAAIYYPFTDLIVSDPYKDLADGLIIAFFIGQSKVVGGITTDMIAYADNDVFVQIWIGTEDKLPRMARAVYRNDAAHLRHELELSNWQLDIDVPSDAFTPANASNANPIPFAHPNPKPARGAKSTLTKQETKK